MSIAPISSLLNIWPLTNLSAPILAITLATSVGDTPALDKAVTKSICSSVKSVIDAPCGLTVARGSCTVGCMLVRPPLATAADEVDGDGAGGFKLGGVFAKTKGISRLVDVGSCSTDTGSSIDMEERFSSGRTMDLFIDRVVRSLGTGSSKWEFHTSAEPESRMTGSVVSCACVCVRRLLQARSIITIIARTAKPPTAPPMIA